MFDSGWLLEVGPYGVIGLVIVYFGRAILKLVEGRISVRFRYTALCAIIGLAIIILGALVYIGKNSTSNPTQMLPGTTSHTGIVFATLPLANRHTSADNLTNNYSSLWRSEDCQSLETRTPGLSAGTAHVSRPDINFLSVMV